MTPAQIYYKVTPAIEYAFSWKKQTFADELVVIHQIQTYLLKSQMINLFNDESIKKLHQDKAKELIGDYESKYGKFELC